MGRLQRDYSGTTLPVSTFVHVLYRHGCTMGFIAVTLIFLQSTPDVFWAVISDFSESPSTYIVALLSALGFFLVFLVSKGVPLSRIQGLWIVYLLYISIVEELAFRLFLPMVIEPSAGFLSAICDEQFSFRVAPLFYPSMEMEKLRVCLFRRNRSQQAAGKFWRFSFISIGSFRSYFPEHAVAARYFDHSERPRVNTGDVTSKSEKIPLGRD